MIFPARHANSWAPRHSPASVQARSRFIARGTRSPAGAAALTSRSLMSRHLHGPNPVTRRSRRLQVLLERSPGPGQGESAPPGGALSRGGGTGSGRTLRVLQAVVAGTDAA